MSRRVPALLVPHPFFKPEKGSLDRFGGSCQNQNSETEIQRATERSSCARLSQRTDSTDEDFFFRW